MSMRDDILEISDVIVRFHPKSLKREPVNQAEAISALCGAASPYAHQVVRDIPQSNGVLDNDAVDQLLVEAHSELQRLWEEFFHGPRVALILRHFVNAIRASGISRKLRVVDIGCGPGFILRWLAAHEVLKEELVYVGVDCNSALIRRAQQLARAEQLPVQFILGNAFSLNERADIFISSGVLHHFRGLSLKTFFEAQANCKPFAFAHFDIQKSWVAPLGGLLFHAARMRTPLARYDGWISAMRAHDGRDLVRLAQSESPKLRIGRYNPPLKYLPICRTLTGVLGVRPEFEAHLSSQISVPIDWGAR